MLLFLIILSAASFWGQLVTSAPAVTSVHVSFVSGNQKTHYSHGTHVPPAIVQYSLEAAPSGDLDTNSLHLHRREQRSISKGALVAPTFEDVSIRTRRRYRGHDLDHVTGTTATTSDRVNKKVKNQAVTHKETSTVKSGGDTLNDDITITTTTKTYKRRYRVPPSPLTFRTTTPSALEMDSSSGATAKNFPLRRLRSRFMSPLPTAKSAASFSTAGGPATEVVPSGSSKSAASSSLSKSDMSTTTSTSTTSADITKAETRPKDSKAFKRSPYIENFESRGITFPDFDEFGGNDFGALRNFIGTGTGASGVADTGPGNIGGGGLPAGPGPIHGPEGLSPNGVFLPPLPTEAADYTEDSGGHGHSDPYLADPETAKYAAQHPPFFAGFPHKRTVLDLNERRVQQGLEPNILRSIRPFFPFFEAAKPRHHPGSHQHLHDDLHGEIGHHPGGVVVAEVHGNHHHHLLPSGFATAFTSGSPTAVAAAQSPPPVPPSSSNHLEAPNFSVFNRGTPQEHLVINSAADPTTDPNLLLYAQSVVSNPLAADVAEAWSIFPHKKK